jgi:hypothetical protein
MNHKLSFVVEIMRNDIGEADEEKGNEGWLIEGNEREPRIIEACLIVFFARTGNFSCLEEA